MTQDDRQRLFLGLLLAAHDGDERGFRALVRDVPRPVLVEIMRSLAEGVVGWQVASEPLPGDARDQLASAALTAACR